MENTAIIVEENKINTNVTMKMSLGVIKSNLSMIEKSVDKVVSDLKNTTYAGTREDRIKMMKKDRASISFFASEIGSSEISVEGSFGSLYTPSISVKNANFSAWTALAIAQAASSALML